MVNEKMLELGKQSSAIRELFEYAKIRKKEVGEDKVFDFSIGNPSVITPKEVTDKLIELLSNEDPISLHGYSSAIGYENVRKAIAKYTNETFSSNISYNHILITSGAAAALAMSFGALLNKGDEVIVLAPFWPEYKVLVEQANGTLISIDCDKKTFLPDYEILKKSINEKTKALVINTPNNPTGVVYDDKVIEKIADILNEKQKEYNHNIYLISDEPYRDLIYVDKKHPFITKFYDNSIVIYSFSKSISLPGERIGYVIVGDKVNDKDDVYNAIKGCGRALGYVCANTLFQQLIPYCLGMTSNIDEYKENQEILYNHLVKLGYEVIKPEGAFYLFMKALQDDANEFSLKAKSLDLLLVPSDSFGIKGYVRISYCVSKKQIIDSLPVFEKLMNLYKK